MGSVDNSLSVYNEGNLITKLGVLVTKIFAPAQAGISNHNINKKRNAVIKAYNSIQKASESKVEAAEKKFEEAYIEYLGIIDRLEMDIIYKKAKTNKASEYEKEALSKYYTIIRLKEEDKNEFNFKKQQYLLDLDINVLKESGKDKIVQDFKPIYLYEMEQLFKSLLKHYSIKLTERMDNVQKEKIYLKIFDTLEDYTNKVIPIKKIEDKDVMKDYNLFTTYEVGKLDQIDIYEKRLILLSISRKMFVHSLPLVVAEKCYVKLLKDIRSLVVDTKFSIKRENAVKLLLKAIEQYNDKLLKVKIYWSNAEDRKIYNDFVDGRKELELSRDKIDEHDYEIKKQILFFKSDMKFLNKYGDRYYRVIKYYKNRLVDLGAMRLIKNSYITLDGEYTAVRHRKVNVW